jgi:hypothetical protein
LAAAGILFYFPVISYKCLNKIYNGNFAIADRGPINLYGNVARRVGPLTSKKYLTSLSFATDVCANYFKPQECLFWDFNTSDDLGIQKADELTGLHLPPQAVSDNLLRLSKKKALNNLPQYILLTATESLRVFFWETTAGLHYAMAALTFFSLFYCCFSLNHLPGLMKHILVIILFFVAFSSLFAIMPRHILPIVPLFLIVISYSFNSFLPRNRYEE